jgi:CRISPR-associated protein Csm2
MVIKFYADPKNRIINPELMADDAQKWAIKVSKAGLNTRGDKLEKNKISQLRKFFDEVVRLSDLLRNGEEYRNVIPFLKMLKAKLAYAEGRKLITKEFNDLICQLIEEVKEDDRTSFDLLISFFEAFIGFYKFEESKYK